MRDTTLCFPVDTKGRILLGRKKRGFGVSKWNGFGGKIEPGETFRQCAIRELQEETGLQAKGGDLDLVGLLDFRFIAAPELNHLGYVYFVRSYEGIITETEEMEPKWFSAESLPYEQMWKGDKTWIPLLLTGKRIKGTVTFAEDNDTVYSIDIHNVDSLSD